MAKILKNHCSPPLPFTGFVYILMTVNFRPLCDSCDKKMDSKCDDVARWDCRPERWNRVKQTPFEFKKMSMSSGLSHFMILRYLLSSLFSRVVLPTQAENVLLNKRQRKCQKVGVIESRDPVNVFQTVLWQPPRIELGVIHKLHR